MSVTRVSMKPAPDQLKPRLPDERHVASHKARYGRELGQCPLCLGWIHRGSLVVITSHLRVIHAGCWISAKEAA